MRMDFGNRGRRLALVPASHQQQLDESTSQTRSGSEIGYDGYVSLGNWGGIPGYRDD